LLLGWVTTSSVAAPLPQKQTTKSPHGPLAIPCENCHTATAWRPIRTVPEFDHSKTKYPLRGLHEKVKCEECHVKPVFTDVGKNCEDCHVDVHNRQMGTNCAECHTVQGWNVAVQEVKAHQNRFPLLGAHAALQCEDCHKQAAVGQFLGLSTACISCHQPDLNRTATIGGNVPNHVSANFPTTCETCHTFDTWSGATFNHNTTGFPLLNSHQMAPAGKVSACTDCHVNGNYNLAALSSNWTTDCGNTICHLSSNYGGGWSGTTNPNHQAAPSVFPVAGCSTCHNTVSFLTATFDHSTTGFPLTNSHQTAPAGKINACTDCHINNNYNLNTLSSNWPTDCGNTICHLTTNYGGGWQGTNNPPHAAAPTSFPVAGCSTCHNTVSFLTSTFDHSTTGFALTNAHQTAPAGKINACTDCHINGNYNLAPLADNGNWPTDCQNAICHMSTNYGGGWSGTTNPVHKSAGAPFAAANCSTCHNTVSFLTAIFDHSTTGFPLQNSHQMAPAGKINACTDCHISNNYNLAPMADNGNWPTDCQNAICHMSTNYGGGWQGTNNPSHSAAPGAYPVAACSTCHNTVSFLTSTFDHSTTGFPLTNSHQLAPAGKINACTDCHVNNNYNLAPMADNGNWPTDCQNAICHMTTNYGGGWSGTNNPPHASAGPTFAAANCSTCHNTVSFLTATFDHTTTGFPLTNSHQTAPAGKINACTDCHINNNYNLAPMADNGNWPTDCQNAICHMSTNYGGGWSGTNNPAHSTAGAPFAAANCSTCHNTISFLTAVFDHSTTGFPLTGSHQLAPAGKVNLCTDCHTANNYAKGFPSVDCISCHQAAWNTTATLGGNVPNHIAAGFPSATAQCTMCHDTVLWTDGKFDHSTTGFPLQGPHMIPPRTAVTGAIGPMVNACTDCHIGGNYTANYLSPGDCYTPCHQTYYTNAQTYGPTVPNHVAANYPTTCTTCHTTYVTTAWLGAVFNHTYFRIPHHGSVCTDCHINATNYKLESCENCHTTPTAHQPGMSHPNVCSPSPACWYTTGGSYGPGSRCYDCHKG
jgi:hypothetical protein